MRSLVLPVSPARRPYVLGLTPSFGSGDGGDSVTINLSPGAGPAVTGVTFGGSAATITGRTANSVTVTTPAGAEGVASVRVVTGFGVLRGVTSYEYTSGVGAWYAQHWGYINAAAMIADAYATNTGGGGTLSLLEADAEGGQSDVDKAFRATYNTDGISYASLGLRPPLWNVDKPRELWIEIYLRYDAAWEIASDDKTFFLLEDHTDADGPTGGISEVARWELHMVHPSYWYGGPSGGLGAGLPDYFKYTNPIIAWDGNWHRLRFHVKMSSAPTATNGIWRVWWDDTLVFDEENVPTGSPSLAYFRNITLGANADPTGSGVRDWGRIRMFTVDPGWEA